MMPLAISSILLDGADVGTQDDVKAVIGYFK